MKAIVLIAANYVREQRWALFLLLLWVVIGAAVISFGRLEREDALFFLKQQAIYGVAFSAFLASSAIHNDRRSRRILAVLSKGIERVQYLAGIIVGLLFISVVYCLTMGAFGTMVLGSESSAPIQLWSLMALLIVACGVAATTAILFSTFLPPLVAISLTAVALGTSVGLAQLRLTRDFLPVYAIMDTISSYEFRAGWTMNWSPALWGIVQAVGLWLLASWIFSRRDIAVAVE